MALVALTLSLAIAALGAVAVAAPTALVAVSRPFLTPAGLYAAAALRLALGTALFLAAPGSRLPKTLRIVGIVVIVGGIATPFIGVDRARAVVDWWTARGPALMRVWGGIALAFGLFLIYAVTPRQRRSQEA